MSISTQIRLQQVTGSVPVVSIGQGAQDPGAADVQELLAAYAKALANIHGETQFLAQTPGLIEHATGDVVLKADDSGGKVHLDANNEVLVDADGSANEAIKLAAPNGGMRMDASTLMSGSAAGIRLQAAATLDLWSDGKVYQRSLNGDADSIKLDSSGGVQIYADGDKLDLQGENGIQLLAMDTSNGGLFLSGAVGVAFATDATHAGATGGIDLAHQTDGADFISKFSSSHSILEAINELKDEVQSGEPTLFRVRLTADDNAPAVVTTFSKIAGDVSSFEPTAGDNKLEVFVNGQLLVSGSSEDYVVTATDEITFAFDLKVDDVISVYDRS